MEFGCNQEHGSQEANNTSSTNCGKCSTLHINDAISLKVQIAALHGTISDLRIALTQQAHADRLRISDLNRANTELNAEIRILRETNDELNQERISYLDKLCKLENTVLALERKNNDVESARKVDEDLRLRAEASRAKVESLLVSILSSCDKMAHSGKVEAPLPKTAQPPPPPLNVPSQKTPSQASVSSEKKPMERPPKRRNSNSCYLGEPTFTHTRSAAAPTQSYNEPSAPSHHGDSETTQSFSMAHYRDRSRHLDNDDMIHHTSQEKSYNFEPVFLDRSMKQYLTHIFAKADRNHDGKITAIEIVKAIKHNPQLMDLIGVEGKTREQKKDFLIYKMSEMDTDNDGAMSLEEFLYWYKSTIHPSESSQQPKTKVEIREAELTKRIEQLENKYSKLLENERKKWKIESLSNAVPQNLRSSSSLATDVDMKRDHSNRTVENRIATVKPGQSYLEKIEETERKIMEFLQISRNSQAFD